MQIPVALMQSFLTVPLIGGNFMEMQDQVKTLRLAASQSQQNFRIFRKDTLYTLGKF